MNVYKSIFSYYLDFRLNSNLYINGDNLLYNFHFDYERLSLILHTMMRVYSFLHRMLNMHSQYDNMRKNVMLYALICINNHEIISITCILSRHV